MTNLPVYIKYYVMKIHAKYINIYPKSWGHLHNNGVTYRLQWDSAERYSEQVPSATPILNGGHTGGEGPLMASGGTLYVYVGKP